MSGSKNKFSKAEKRSREMCLWEKHIQIHIRKVKQASKKSIRNFCLRLGKENDWTISLMKNLSKKIYLLTYIKEIPHLSSNAKLCISITPPPTLNAYILNGWSPDNLYKSAKQTLNLPDQAFTNCVHGYDRQRNVHANGVTRARKFVHGFDSSI